MTPSGYAFVQTAEGEFFVPASKTGGAFDGDTVEIVTSGRSNGVHKAGGGPSQRPNARVVRVIHRAHETVVGRYEVADPFGIVVPADERIPYDIFTMRADNPDIADGSMVRVRLAQYPTRNEAATGVVEEVLGGIDEGRVDSELVIAHHQLQTRFSDAALEQAAHAEVDDEGALREGYKDLRSRFVFTIDPQDARDYDDAISLERGDGGTWLLGVHIADVSHYVEWGCSIDLDARRRATSVYLADRVLPMLPPRLSDDVCSLVPGMPRRTFTVEITLGADGAILGWEFYPSVIESKVRLDYGQAQRIIEGGASALAADELMVKVDEVHEREGKGLGLEELLGHLTTVLQQLDVLAVKRMALREQRGGIDFETVEAKVVLDDRAHPVDVHLRQKTRATSVVEEAMLAANECAARQLLASGVPGLFRVHDAPLPDSMAQVVSILQEFGYDRHVSMERFVMGDSRAIQKVLALVEGRPESRLVSQLILRCMQRAVYCETHRAHYALAVDAYCHFTSPIRRYPDLVVHRMLKAALLGKPATFEQQVESLGWLAVHCSRMERVAEDAARQTQEMKLVEYMRQFVGHSFSGVIVGVASHGVYVGLQNTAEGLIPVRYLGHEPFAHDPSMYLLRGLDTGMEYRLGQRLAVVVEAAPPHARRLELRLADGKHKV